MLGLLGTTDGLVGPDMVPIVIDVIVFLIVVIIDMFISLFFLDLLVNNKDILFE